MQKPIENPKLSDVVLSSGRKSSESVWISLHGGAIRSKVFLTKNKATIDFDLFTDYNNWDLSPESQSKLSELHRKYLNMNRSRGEFQGGANVNFGKTSIRFDVLKDDAEEWFNLVYSTLANKDNLVKVELGNP